MDLVVSDPAALQKFLLAEMARWEKVVKQHGIKPDKAVLAFGSGLAALEQRTTHGFPTLPLAACGWSPTAIAA